MRRIQLQRVRIYGELLDFGPDYPYLTAGRFEMASRRLLNISVRPGSRAHEAYYSSARSSARALTADELAAGFQPHPELNLTFRGGRTITDLVFANRYVGGAGSWDAGDIANIDNGLAEALTDSGLQTVVEQYYSTPISSRMLPSAVLPDPAPGRIYKDHADAVVRIDDDAADSLHGLGGYHGSIHITAGGADIVVYYAVGVYSEGQNGIPAFGQSWKNVVATFYHELNEARTDTDVEEAIRTGDDSKLGWYSNQGGEIGDIPIDEAGNNLGLVFREVQLADGSGTVPVQLLWSNADSGPAGHVP
jgi:hypothetical protein